MGSGAFSGRTSPRADVDRQFPPPNGESELFSWNRHRRRGENQGYGIRGISSGRMPHFGSVLTKSQINEIMAYEEVAVVLALLTLASEGAPKGLVVPDDPRRARGGPRASCSSAGPSTSCSVPTSAPRLGFLVVFTSLAGFIVLMLSTLWVAGQFPNGKLGSLPKWNVKEVIEISVGADPLPAMQQSPVGLIRRSRRVRPRPRRRRESPVRSRPTSTRRRHAEHNPFAKFGDVTYKAVRTFRVGGSKPIWWSKKGEYAAVEICTLTVKPADYDELNNPPFVPDCDPTIPTQIVVMHHDLGSLRRPSAITMFASAVLLAGFLYGLYVVENRQRQLAAAPPPAPAPADETPVPVAT